MVGGLPPKSRSNYIQKEFAKASERVGDQNRKTFLVRDLSLRIGSAAGDTNVNPRSRL